MARSLHARASPGTLQHLPKHQRPTRAGLQADRVERVARRLDNRLSEARWLADLDPGLPLREVERRYILRTLSAAHGSRTAAAKMLGISLRALQYKLKAYTEENGPLGVAPESARPSTQGPRLSSLEHR